jgi:hypothetical protein
MESAAESCSRPVEVEVCFQCFEVCLLILNDDFISDDRHHSLRTFNLVLESVRKLRTAERTSLNLVTLETNALVTTTEYFVEPCAESAHGFSFLFVSH